MRDQQSHGITRNDGIGVNTNKDLLISPQMLQSKIQSISFTGIRLSEDQQAPRGFLSGKRASGNVQCPVARSIINNNNAQVSIAGAQRGADGTFDYLLFVVCGN